MKRNNKDTWLMTYEEFAAIGQTYDVLRLSFLGRIKG